MKQWLHATITKIFWSHSKHRWAPPAEFYDLVSDPAHDIIKLQQVDDESNSIFDARKIATRIRRLPGTIKDTWNIVLVRFQIILI